MDAAYFVICQTTIEFCSFDGIFTYSVSSQDQKRLYFNCPLILLLEVSYFYRIRNLPKVLFALSLYLSFLTGTCICGFMNKMCHSVKFTVCSIYSKLMYSMLPVEWRLIKLRQLNREHSMKCSINAVILNNLTIYFYVHNYYLFFSSIFCV